RGAFLSQGLLLCHRKRRGALTGLRRTPGRFARALEGVTAQRPIARRSASRGGRPASRIFFCALATSYWIRRSSIEFSVVSYTTYAARGLLSRGWPTLPTLMKYFFPGSTRKREYVPPR